MKDFIIGPSEDEPKTGSEDPTGKIDNAEELEPSGSQDEGETGPEQSVQASSENSQSEVDSETDDANETAVRSEVSPDDETQLTKPQEVDLEQLVEGLHSAKSVVDRVVAVRELGRSRNQRAAAHLVAAMFDDEPQVRLAAEEAMALLDQSAPSVSTADAGHQSDLDSPRSSESTESTDESKSSTHEGKAVNGMAHLHLERAATDSGEPEVLQNVPSPQLVADEKTTDEELKLIQEHEAARRIVDEIHHQIFKLAAARTGQEKQAQWRIKREAKLRDDIAERVRSEEESRKRAEAEAEHRRLEEIEAIQAELEARTEAEAEAHRLAQEESRLRLEAGKQSHLAEEISRRHHAMVVARKEAAQAAERVEAERALAVAEQQRQAEIERLNQEQENLHLATEETARRRADVEAARQQEESEAAKLAEAHERMRTAEEIRARTEEARAKVEEELRERVENEERLLAEAREHAQQEQQRLAAEFRQHQESFELELAAQRQQAEGLREATAQQHQVEVQRLRQEEENLKAATDEVTRLRAEAEAARARAEKDAETLAEAQARMVAAEGERAKVESERVKVEAELVERVKKGERILAEAKQRALKEQQRLEDEARLHQESEERRLAELVIAREAAESHNDELVKREHEITSEIDRLRIADAEARKRITAAEATKRTAEQAYELLAGQIQRLEAEAHTSKAAEERMAARIETEKLNLTNAAQVRAEHEKRIREELEVLRRSEQEENNRLKGLAIERAQAEERIKKLNEDVLAEEEARRVADLELASLRERQIPVPEAEPVEEEPREETVAEVQPLAQPTEVQVDETVTVAAIHDPVEAVPQPVGEEVPDAVGSYLRSVDPYKRAAAVAELGRTNAEDAFSLIVTCFDDQSPQVRNAAALALRALNPLRVVDSFNRALEDASAKRRENIGAAIAGSGLATDAVNNLASDSREATYNALSILFVMAKAGETKPLIHAIEEHESDEVRRAVIKLMTLSGHSSAGDAALQRRVLGVAANRQKTRTDEPNSMSDVRSKMAEVEVKRAVNGKQKPEESS